MTYALERMAEVMQAKIYGGRAGLQIGQIATDTRTVRPGDLFACIRGKNVDGHDFARQAADAGAAAVLADRQDTAEISGIVPVLLADDVVKALGRLGRDMRAAFQGTLVAVTGTAGKTTLKENLASILSREAPTAKSRLNLNTQIGIPVSMMDAAGDERFWVFEAGISKPDDMDDLGSLLQPDFAVILNVGAAHTEGLGERGVAWHKARLLRYLRPGGPALVCADYPDLVREAAAIRPDLTLFSAKNADAPYTGRYAGADADGKGMYELSLRGETITVRSRMVGSYGAESLIAAAAAAHMLGAAPERIAAALADAPDLKRRFVRTEIRDGELAGWTLIDDSYNSNPLATERMLESAAEIAAGRPLYCVLGEMRELGQLADREHAGLGRKLAAHAPRAVFWAGGHAEDVLMGLRSGGSNAAFVSADDPRDFISGLRNLLPDGTRPGVIFFKASLSVDLARHVKAFREAFHVL